MSVLVVDDDSAHRLMIRRALQRIGVTGDITECVDEASLLAALGGLSTPPLVCFLDADCGGVHGAQLARHVTATYPSALLVMLSTSGLNADRAQAEAAGIRHFVEKQGSLDELAAALKKTITDDILRKISCPAEA